MPSAASPALFNADWYLSRNPDVAAAVEAGLIAAYDHFLQFGAAEGRSPSSWFDPGFYLSQNPDVAAAVDAGLMTAAEHFLQYGQAEVRRINPFIDLAAYLDANADLAAAHADGIISPLAHLLTYGLAEGRNLGNGVSLHIFANDPAFQTALERGDGHAALQRMEAVAPFLPSFQPPEGWVPSAATPIPVDFVPPSGVTLIVPPSVSIPPDTVLPPIFETPRPPAPPEPAPRPPSPPKPAPKPPTPPKPAPEPPPPVEDDWTPPPFTVTNYNGERSFSGTATGIIRTDIGADGVISFIRDGITVRTDLDLHSWVAGRDLIKLQAGQVLALSPAQASLFSAAAAAGGGAAAPSYAIVGRGTVQIEANEMLAYSVVDLLAVAPQLDLGFTTGKTVVVPQGTTMYIRPEHADALSIAGDGITWVTGSAASPVPAVVNVTDLAFWGVGSWIAASGSPGGPVTLDIGSDGAGNIITGSAGDDHITVRGDGWKTLFPGKGKDTVMLSGSGGNAVVIEAGAAQLYVREVTFNMDYQREGHELFMYLALYQEPLPSSPPYPTSLEDQVVIAEYANGQWGPFLNYPVILPDVEPAYAVSLDSSTGVVTIVRDAYISVYAAEQGGGGQGGSGPAIGIGSNSVYGDSPRPADSHFWQMDEIHGFDLAKDKIFSAHLYYGGNGASADMLANGQFTTADSSATIDVVNGIATVVAGTLPSTDALEYVLQELSRHMSLDRRIVAYEHEGSTYLMHGDGKSGLDVSDMVLKLSGVTGLTDLSGIIV